MTSPSASQPSPRETVLLVLGAGWTYQFLHPCLDEHKISHVATTTNGHDHTIAFKFDPDSDDLTPFKILPSAEYVLVTFPLKGKGPSSRLLSMYAQTHPATTPRWIQLGSTGVWTTADWNSSRSPIDLSNARGIAEDELMALDGCVLNLAGLYGGGREPRNWVDRVVKSKEQLADKGALHLIHGWDVARAVVGVIETSSTQNVSEEESRTAPVRMFGRRWIVADCVSYDWWSLIWDWMGESVEDELPASSNNATTKTAQEKAMYRQWVMDLMKERSVQGLPRSVEALGRKLDAREFWNAIGALPTRTLAR